MPVQLQTPDGKVLTFDSGQEDAAREALKAGAQVIGNPTVVDREGQVHAVNAQGLLGALSTGNLIEGSPSAINRDIETEREQKYTEPLEKVQAFGEGGLRALSLTLADPLLPEGAEERRQYNPGTELAGELLGTGLTLGAGGEGLAGKVLAATPAGIAVRAGQAAGKLYKAGSAAALAVEAGVETGLWGAGQAVSEAIVQDKPLTIESLASNIGSSALFGVGVGGTIGLGGKTFARARALDELAEVAAPLPGYAREVDDAARASFRDADQAFDRLAQERAAASRADVAARRKAAQQEDFVRRVKAASDQRVARQQAEHLAANPGDAVLTRDIVSPAPAPVEEFAGPPTVFDGEQLSLDLPPVQKKLNLEPPAKAQVSPTLPHFDPGQLPRRAEAIGAHGTQVEMFSPVPPPRPQNLFEEAALAGRQADNYARELTRPPVEPTPAVPVEAPAPQFDPNPWSLVGTPEQVAAERAAHLQAAKDAVEAEMRPQIVEARKEYLRARMAMSKYFGKDLNVDLQKLIRTEPKKALKAIRAFDEFTKAAAGVEKLVQGTQTVSRVRPVTDHLLEKLPGHLHAPVGGIGALDVAAVASVLGVPVEDIPTVGPTASWLLNAYAAGRGIGLLASKRTARLLQKVGGALDARVFARVPLGGAVRAVISSPFANVARLAFEGGRMQEKIAAAAKQVTKALTKQGPRTAVVMSAKAALDHYRYHPAASTKKDPALARMDEVRRAVASPQTIRDFLDERLAPIRATNFDVGNGLVDHYEQRLKFLFSKLPPVTTYAGRDLPHSQAEISRWARYAKAADNPLSILDDMENRMLSVEAVEAVQTLYPRLFEEIQMGMIQVATEQGDRMPHALRMQLAILYKAPAIEPSVSPDSIFAYQQMYQATQEAQAQTSAPPPRGTPTPPAPTKAQALTDR